MITNKCPSGLELWTLDEAAECLRIPEEVYAELWRLLGECRNKTPLGGDGSGGTVEDPSERLDSANDDKLGTCWEKLSGAAQEHLRKAAETEGL